MGWSIGAGGGGGGGGLAGAGGKAAGGDIIADEGTGAPDCLACCRVYCSRLTRKRDCIHSSCSLIQRSSSSRLASCSIILDQSLCALSSSVSVSVFATTTCWLRADVRLAMFSKLAAMPSTICNSQTEPEDIRRTYSLGRPVDFCKCKYNTYR